MDNLVILDERLGMSDNSYNEYRERLVKEWERRDTCKEFIHKIQEEDNIVKGSTGEENTKIYEVITERNSIYIVGEQVRRINKRCYRIDERTLCLTDNDIVEVKEICSVKELFKRCREYNPEWIILPPSYDSLPIGLKEYIHQIILEGYHETGYMSLRYTQ